MTALQELPYLTHDPVWANKEAVTLTREVQGSDVRYPRDNFVIYELWLPSFLTLLQSCQGYEGLGITTSLLTN
jgi:hypothetical protein